MTERSNPPDNSVKKFPGALHSTFVSDELNRIFSMLQETCPEDSQISFEFDGKLQVHIDIRNRDDITLVEAMLPTLGAGLFHDVRRGSTPHHPFFHRISALVDR